MHKKLDTFTKAFLNCILWSTPNVVDDNFPFDLTYTIKDINKTSKNKLVQECKEFQKNNKKLLEQAYKEYPYCSEKYAGEAFCLARNKDIKWAIGEGAEELENKLFGATKQFNPCIITISAGNKLNISEV